MSMEREDRDLLLRYLSMALLYRVKLKKYNEDNAVELYSINLEHETIQYWKYKSGSLQIGGYGHLIRFDKLQFKPYLRPLSSMTDEEDRKRIFLGIWRSSRAKGCEVTRIAPDSFEDYSSQPFQKALDFLLKNHFDIFGLIPKGLAIAVTEENNPYKAMEE